MSLARLPVQAAAVALLLVLVCLQFSSLAATSPTMDEPNHLVSGYAFLARGDTRIKLNSPILNNALGALPLAALQPHLELAPADDPGWDANEYNDIADRFVWHNTASPFRIMYLARFPFMAVGWLLGALIFRWARERGGSRAGLFALALYVFCPNLLAHSRLVMTDFVPAALTCATLHAFDRSRRPGRRRTWIVFTGIALGLALASKFSLVMLIPAMAALALMAEGRANVGRAIGQVVVIVLVAGLAVWAVYGLQVGPVSAGGISVPAPGYWGEVLSARYYLGQPWPNYLFGQTSDTGWWYYFPVAFFLKTPLPILLLLAVALVRTVHRRSWRQDAIFLLPFALICVGLLFSTNNLGYRYLLPLLPLAFVYASAVVPRDPFTWSPRHLSILALLAWQIIGTIRIYPYYLTFFNEIAGGPDRGRYALSDSNIDWGQDLVGLKRYVDEHFIDRIKLSYFGIAHPTAYGLQTDPLLPVRTAMHDQGAWWLHTYHPADPAPGMYAISVANLMGGIWIDQDTYAFFRERAPDATIGNSIYVFTVPPRGESVDLALAGLHIDQIDPDTYRRLGTNDVRPRWFDATTSLIAPPGETWIAIAHNQHIATELADVFEGVEPFAQARTADAAQPYNLYHFDLSERLRTVAATSEQQAGEHTLPLAFAQTAELLGYRIETRPSSGAVSLVTFWRVGDQVVTPLQLFVHASGDDGQIVAQEDRLDVPAYGWRAGDLVAQVNRLTLPAGSGPVWIEVGLYNPATDERLPIVSEGLEIGRPLRLAEVSGE